MNTDKEIEVTEEITEDVEAPSKPDSVEDSIRKAYEQLSGKAEEEEAVEASEENAATSEKEPAAAEATEATEAAEGEKEATETATDETIEAPQRWTAKAKEWFRTLPKQAQEEFARASRDLEGHTTKLWQELNRSQKKYKDLDQITEHYAKGLHAKGITVTQAAAELFAANEALEQEPVAALARIMKAKGVTAEQLAEHLSGKGGATVQAATPEINALRSEVAELHNWRQQQLGQTQQQQVQAIAAEFESVRDEMDASGKYKFPLLHEPQQTAALKPLVSALRESHPELSWGDALKQAYTFRFGTPSTQTGARIQTPQASTATKQNNSRARSVAIAGKSSGSSSTALDIREVKVPRDTGDTVRLAMQLLGK